MKHSLHDVLVLTPLSDEGEVAIRQAMNLQKRLSFRIFLLHIIPTVSLFRRLFFPRKISEIEDEALVRLTDFARNFFKGNVPENVILKVLSGDVVSTMIKETYHDNFHFIILKRTHKKKSVHCALVQNEIDKIISHSHCPVLTINKDATEETIKSILVPIDIAEGTKKRLLWVSLFAHKTHAKVHVVSALNIEMDERKSLAFRNAEKIKSMLHERKILCDVEILKVHDQARHEAVLDYIEAKKPDIVVVRKHHISSSFKAGIGDFSKEIIHGSSVPVFTVSQPQGDIASKLK